jgi:hypothetical protein
MEVEGLFRVPGQSMIMSRLKDDFDAAGTPPSTSPDAVLALF